MSEIENKPGIVVAFDMENRMQAIELADMLECAKGNFVIKVGRPLEMQYGIDILLRIRDVTGIPIIYDGKIADIPYISAVIAETAYDYGADAVIVHSCIGTDVVKAVVELDKGDVIAIIEMSHPGWFEQTRAPRSIAWSCAAMGVNGIVMPATRPKLIPGIKDLLPPDMYIISPGVGAQGADIGDAAVQGATYEIVGRGIYEHDDPVRAAEFYYKALMSRL